MAEENKNLEQDLEKLAKQAKDQKLIMIILGIAVILVFSLVGVLGFMYLNQPTEPIDTQPTVQIEQSQAQEPQVQDSQSQEDKLNQELADLYGFEFTTKESDPSTRLQLITALDEIERQIQVMGYFLIVYDLGWEDLISYYNSSGDANMSVFQTMKDYYQFEEFEKFINSAYDYLDYRETIDLSLIGSDDTSLLALYTNMEANYLDLWYAVMTPLSVTTSRLEYSTHVDAITMQLDELSGIYFDLKIELQN